MTISDVAKLAGVSSAAVSRYLNGGSLSEEKREAVRRAIEQTDYSPDRAAQTLRTGRVNQIGVIVPKINSEAVSRVTAGVAEVLSASSFLLLLGNTDQHAAMELSYLAAMQKNRVAGIILMGTVLTAAHVAAFRECKVPLVITGQKYPDVPCICNDDENAARELTRMFVRRGRRHIAFIGVLEKDVAAGLGRRMGTQSALREAGLEAEAMPRYMGVFEQETGYDGARELLAKHPETDGLVCATDMIALGALKALKEMGKRIPEDISIAGIGDSWAGKIVQPPLTTVHLYHKQCGAEAARMLLEMIDRKHPLNPVRQMTLGYTVVERGSI